MIIFDGYVMSIWWFRTIVCDHIIT